VGESGKAVYSDDVEKFFGQRWLSPPSKKLARNARVTNAGYYDVCNNERLRNTERERQREREIQTHRHTDRQTDRQR